MRRFAGWLVVPALAVLIGSAPGAIPAEGSSIPIDHVVVYMQENRSFDHYLGQLHHEGQPGAEAEPGNASNPDPTGGKPIRAFHKSNYCEVADLNHSWTGTHLEWDGGAMDGFTAQNVDPADPTGSRTMGYYDRRDLPFYYGLYSTFATSDRYFSSVLGPTFPNRFYLLAGTSFGHLRNDLPASPNDFSQKTIFNELDDAGVTWRVYAWQPPVAFSMIFSYVREHAAGHVFPISQYFTDAANGDLPDVSYIDPIFLGPPDVENDEHPPSNIQVGQLSVSEVVDALFHSPDWPSSALFLTYDEHGGFYDHVPPPAAVPPDGIPPSPLSATDVKDGFTAFDHYGIRVPAVVVSPYSRRHFVSHVTDDHTSILRFIETRFGLPALTARDAQADAMLGFFDFSRRSFATPPTLPAASVDPGQLAACATAPPNGGV